MSPVWHFLQLSVLSSFLPSKSSICQVEVFSLWGKREMGWGNPSDLLAPRPKKNPGCARAYLGRFDARGLPYMRSAKFSDFLTPSPPVTVTNQLILFLSSPLWGPPPPIHSGRHIWRPPNTNENQSFDVLLGRFLISFPRCYELSIAV